LFGENLLPALEMEQNETFCPANKQTKKSEIQGARPESSEDCRYWLLPQVKPKPALTVPCLVS
jgi:hypothetical protein